MEDRISLQAEKVKQQEYRRERPISQPQETEKMVKKTYLQEMPRTNYLNILVKPPEGDYGVIPERGGKGNMTAEC